MWDSFVYRNVKTSHSVRVLPLNSRASVLGGGGRGTEWIAGLCSLLSVRHLVRTGHLRMARGELILAILSRMGTRFHCLYTR